MTTLLGRDAPLLPAIGEAGGISLDKLKAAHLRMRVGLGMLRLAMAGLARLHRRTRA